jgi:hypothetical protein
MRLGGTRAQLICLKIRTKRDTFAILFQEKINKIETVIFTELKMASQNL